MTVGDGRGPVTPAPDHRSNILPLDRAAPAFPTQAEVDAIRDYLLAQLDDGALAPFANVTREQREVLTGVAYHDPAMLRSLQAALATRVRDQGGTDERFRLEQVNLGVFTQAARLRRRQAEEDRRNRARGERATRQHEQQQQQGSAPQAPITNEMSPDDRIATDNPYLIATGILLRDLSRRIWFDTFYQAVFSDWGCSFDMAFVATKRMGDDEMRKIHDYLQQRDERLTSLSLSECRNVVYFVAERDKRNEALDWLKGLRWDGISRLEMFVPIVYKTPDDPYHRLAGKKTIMGSAKRILEPGAKVDTMLVLMGPQGLRKSMSIEALGGKWYMSSMAREVGSKDWRQELQGHLVVEIPELHSMTNRQADASVIKAALSTRIDYFRAPYAHAPVAHPRTAILMGSTNERYWHRDDTGGRRFWPVMTGDVIDVEWLQENRDQLYAEAVVCLEAGGDWWKIDEAEQRVRIEAQRAASTWEDVISERIADRSLFDGTDVTRRPVFGHPNAADDETRWGDVITMERILSQWLGIPKERHPGASTGRAASIMTRFGFVTKAWRNPNISRAVRIWVRDPTISVEPEPREPPDEALERSSEANEEDRGPPTPDDEDIPF